MGAQMVISGRSIDKAWWRVCDASGGNTGCTAPAEKHGWVPYAALDVRGRTDMIAMVTPAVPPPVARATATPAPTKTCVTGYIYNTAGGVPLRNWVLQLEGPDGTIRRTRSNSNGRYEFNGVVPGVYTVSERVEPGWRVVSPQASVITVAPAKTCVAVDFWNERNQDSGGAATAPPTPER